MLEKKGSCTPSAADAEASCEETSVMPKTIIDEDNGFLNSSSGADERLSPINKSSSSTTSNSNHLHQPQHYHFEKSSDSHSTNGSSLYSDRFPNRCINSSSHHFLTQDEPSHEVIIEDGRYPATLGHRIDAGERSKKEHDVDSKPKLTLIFNDSTTGAGRQLLQKSEENKNCVGIEILESRDAGSSTGSESSGSIASSSGRKRSKSKESYHSSDEQVVIDEEDLLAISDSDYVDNDMPIIPGMTLTSGVSQQHTNNPSSDADSAFEDSHYSGSSDDKAQIKGSSNHTSSRHGGGSSSSTSKNKSKRRPNSKHSFNETSRSKDKSSHKGRKRDERTRCEDIAEIVIDGSAGAGDDLPISDNRKCPPDRNCTGSTSSGNRHLNISLESNTSRPRQTNEVSSNDNTVLQGRGNLRPSRDEYGRIDLELDSTGKSGATGNGASRKNVIFGDNDRHYRPVSDHRRRKIEDPLCSSTNEEIMLMSHLHYPEPTVFDMEVSPINLQPSAASGEHEVRINHFQFYCA
jgi:hypothetical protein